MPRTVLALVPLAFCLALACSSEPPAKAPSKSEATEPGKSITPPGAGPHGAGPHGAGPHGAGPHGAGPHGAGPHSMAPPPAAQPGPPRDVTPSGTTMTAVVDGLIMSVPSEWTREDPANPGGMRKAEFVLPGPGGDARLVVYRFAGGAGGAQANIDRWKGQIEPTAGGDAKAEVRELEVGGLKIAAIDSAGRFVGQSMPGAPPQPAIDDARLLAAAIEGSGDPFYLKLVGPKPTIDLWAPAWTTMLEGLAVEAAPAPAP